MSKTVT